MTHLIKILSFSLILAASVTTSKAASATTTEQNEMIGGVVHKGLHFEARSSTEKHDYGRVLVLKNSTGKPLDSYRILAIFAINPDEALVGDNVIERILKFSPSDDEVTLPLLNFSFTCVVYRSHLSHEDDDRAEDDEADADVIRKKGKMVFPLHGESFKEDAQRALLTVSLTPEEKDDCDREGKFTLDATEA